MKFVLLQSLLVVVLLLHVSNGRVLRKKLKVAHKNDEVGAKKESKGEKASANRCAVGLTAFTTARTTDFTALGKVQYQRTQLNEGDAWNEDSSVFRPAERGTYFFHMSAGAKAFTPVDLTLQGVASTVTLSRKSTTHDGADTLGRDFISPINAEANVYVDNGVNSVLYSEADGHTSLTAFNLEDILDPEDMVIFSVARDSLYASVGVVTFPNEFVNIGNAFDTDGLNRFTANKTGTYFFTLSIGVPNGLNVRAQIKRSTTPTAPLAELWRSSDTHNGPDIINTAVMANLNAGDEVYVELKDGEIYSDSGHQAFFGGFYYNPLQLGGFKMAWSVYSIQKHVAFDTAIDPLPFDDAWVNTANMFSFLDNSVNITVSGLYYINLNVGAQPTRNVDTFVVLKREKTETNIYRASLNHNGEDTLNQGLLVRLFAGNNVRVVVGPNSRTHSDGDHQTIFTGFLLQPE